MSGSSTSSSSSSSTSSSSSSSSSTFGNSSVIPECTDTAVGLLYGWLNVSLSYKPAAWAAAAPYGVVLAAQSGTLAAALCDAGLATSTEG